MDYKNVFKSETPPSKHFCFKFCRLCNYVLDVDLKDHVVSN